MKMAVIVNPLLQLNALLKTVPTKCVHQIAKCLHQEPLLMLANVLIILSVHLDIVLQIIYVLLLAL